MRDTQSQNDEPLFPPEEMINASELREFLFCERAWFLSRQGFRVSEQGKAHRAAGIAFHEARAGAGRQGSSPWVFWLAVFLAGTGLAILLFQLWEGNQ